MRFTVHTPDGRTLSRDDISLTEIIARVQYLEKFEPKARWEVGL